MPLLEGDEPFSVFSSADSRKERGADELISCGRKRRSLFSSMENFPLFPSPHPSLGGGAYVEGTKSSNEVETWRWPITLTHICIREIEKVSFWSCVKINSRKFLNFWTFVEIFFLSTFSTSFQCIYGCPIAGRKLVDFEKFNYSNKLVVQNSLEM